MQLTAGTEEFYLRFNPSTEVDVVTGGGYEVFAVPAAQLVDGDFVPAINNRVYKGPNTSITVPAASGIWGVKAAAYDVFGDTGLNYTPLMTCTVMGKIEDLLQALTGQITSSQLNTDLNTVVESIGPLADEVGAINSTLTDPETGLIAQVTTLQSLVEDPDTGLITKLDGLQSSVTDPATGLVTMLTNLSTVVEDPATGLVTQVAANQASLGDNTAALSVEQKVRASSVAPNWLTGTYNAGSVVIYTAGTPAIPYMFQSLMDGNDTTPSVVAGVATATTKWKPVSANLYAQMMLKTDVNGHITGIGIANDGVTGIIEILADRFAIVDPSHPTASIAPFVVSTVGGVTQVGIDGSLMIDGTLVVGGNVEMGPDAVIEWSNLSVESRTNLRGPAGPDMTLDQSTPTVIGHNWIYSGAISAGQVNASEFTAGTANIGDAAITAAKIGDAAITAAKIGDAQITTAKIGTAQVDTLRIAGAAVTIPVVGKTAGPVAVAASSTLCVHYSSVSLPSSISGQQGVMITCSARIVSDSGGNYDVDLEVRTAAGIAVAKVGTSVANNVNGTSLACCGMDESATAGTNTYYVWITVTDSSVNVHNIYLAKTAALR